jgi:TolB-like protein/tetratricopeptide (TPR) repeat protein
VAADDLQQGFSLGPWLVEPRLGRIWSASGERLVTPAQMAGLVRLARNPGADVDLDEASATELMRLLGDEPSQPRYLAADTPGRYRLIVPVHRVGETASPIDTPPSLFAELRRRSVFRATAAYLLAGWVALQVADVTFAPLHLPAWAMTLLVSVYILGIPVAAAMAWAYDLTPEGLRRESATGRWSTEGVRRMAGIAAVALVSATVGVAGFAWWTWSEQSSATGPATASIAVLPLVDMSPEGSSGYLGDGLSEELSSRLAEVPGLRVAARTSAFAYKDKPVDVRRIGEELGVRYVLEGSVRREADRLRVTVQLIDASTGYHAWTKNYDRDWRNLLGIQEEVSTAITEQLRVVLTPEQQQRVARAPTSSPRAYDFYLAGLSELRQGGGLSHVDEAERFFRKALEEDSQFVRAHAGLCKAGLVRYDRTSSADAMQAAERACRKALQMDGSLRETELALGELYLASGQFQRAEAVYGELRSREPGNADVHIGLARALEAAGRFDAAESSFDEAVATEPGYWYAYKERGNFLFRQGRTRDAVEAFQRVTQLAPSNPSGFNNLGGALLLDGDLPAAAAAFEHSIRIEPSRSAYSNLGTILYHQGKFGEAAQQFASGLELAPEDHRVWSGYADCLWYLSGRKDAALEAYRRAVLYAERALAVDPSDAETWAQLGLYYARLGEADRGQGYVEKAMQLGPTLPYVYYYAALVAAGRGEDVASRELVAKAQQLGYSPKLIAADPALRMTAPTK